MTFPCLAGPNPRELVCSLITKVDGGYKIVLSEIRVIDQVQNDGPFKLPGSSPKNVVSVICFRSSIVPVLEDKKVIDAGYNLSIATRASGTIELSKAKEVYQARQVNGSMSDSEHKALAARLKEMDEQAQVSPPSN
jgi:hypothetical protein